MTNKINIYFVKFLNYVAVSQMFSGMMRNIFLKCLQICCLLCVFLCVFF